MYKDRVKNYLVTRFHGKKDVEKLPSLILSINSGYIVTIQTPDFCLLNKIKFSKILLAYELHKDEKLYYDYYSRN